MKLISIILSLLLLTTLDASEAKRGRNGAPILRDDASHLLRTSGNTPPEQPDLRLIPTHKKMCHKFIAVNATTNQELGFVKFYVTHDMTTPRTARPCTGHLHVLKVNETVRSKGTGKFLFSYALNYMACMGDVELGDVEQIEWLAQPLGIDPKSDNWAPFLERLTGFYTNLGGKPTKKPTLFGTHFTFDHTNEACTAKLVAQAPENCCIRNAANRTFFAAHIIEQITPKRSRLLGTVCYTQDEARGQFSLSKMLLKDELMDDKDFIEQCCTCVANQLSLSVAAVRPKVCGLGLLSLSNDLHDYEFYGDES